jgi:ornithine--oxo-acid transaminase
MEQTLQGLSESRNVNRKENKYGAHNYHPLPVVLDREKGFFWDDGKKYYDFSCLRILP